MKISDKKILLKNVNKNLGKDEWRELTKEILKNDYKGNINTVKLFEKIQILKEDNNKSKGIVFLEFLDSKWAEIFIEKIKQKNFLKQIKRDKESPIVEYAFENTLKERKRNDLIKKLKVLNKKQEEQKLVEQLDG